MQISDIIAYLETIAPLSLQESYDNSGLLVGDAGQEVQGALICLDSTEDIVQEAIDQNCNLIIAHHPIIFGGLKRLTGATYVQRTVALAIKHDIAIYAIHTNLDNVLDNGVNEEIARRLGLAELKILDDKFDANFDSKRIGSGVMGSLSTPFVAEAFLAYLKEKMQLSGVKHTRFHQPQFQKIALCGGSGRFLLEKAIALGADVFISSDFKYHEYFDADGKITIFDIGHYESERFTIDLLQRLLTEKFPTFAAYCAKAITNPIIYG
ncbi:MAG: Nif3-like dinuclear metal center hexameric protein [Saprospiraceae bacterium]|nr:Nif3-like dinuclear metal center hexameric protein [Saprospiraceae bacterium]